MKKYILCIGICGLFGGFLSARPLVLESSLNRVVARALIKKPYYANERVSRLCEAWENCANWARGCYQRDPSFRVKSAQEVTRFRVMRHVARYETQLEVEAVYRGKRFKRTFPRKGNFIH